MNNFTSNTATKRPVFNKKCLVCSDKATCFNFNGLSCETCKIFFRRNATKSEKLKCRRDNNCEITFFTRKCCPACRLKKCFSIGMKLKGKLLNCSTADRDQQANQSIKSNKVSVIQTNLKSDLYSILEDDIKKKINQCDNENDSNSSDNAVKLQAEKNLIKFNEVELQLMEEIKVASNLLVDENTLKEVNIEHDFADTMQLPLPYITHIIRFCKNIKAFKGLSSDDQLTIMKPFFFEFLSIRFSFNFIEKYSGFLVIANEKAEYAVLMRMTILQSHKENVSEKYCKLMMDLKKEMENDPKIRDLLFVHVLFSHRDELKNKELISYHNSIYRHLLIKYLETKYQNKCSALKKYSILVNLLNEQIGVKQIIVDLIQQIDSSKLSHVMVELYNL